VYLSVLGNPHIELDSVPVSLDQSIDNLKLIFNSSNWGNQTEQARKNVVEYFAEQNKTIDLPSSYSVQNVILDSNGQAQAAFANATNIKIQSTSLFRYLKEINLNSNNYMSDALFALLGGEAGFRQFQSENLGLGLDSLIMKTGSGLPVSINGDRVDNKATCFSILKVMHYIKLIADQASLDLGFILLTAGLDRGTYETDLVINKSVVLKTGRLYDVPTLNLAGIVSTQKGLMVFGFLGHEFDNADENLMIEKRDGLLQDLLNFYKEKPMFKTLPQNEIFFL
jgi:D-alanyl-D-alanine carboxypeptidase/D-alanyl-D-alanine-endopeptidase (penicillin-binding protein 4)